MARRPDLNHRQLELGEARDEPVDGRPGIESDENVLAPLSLAQHHLDSRARALTVACLDRVATFDEVVEAEAAHLVRDGSLATLPGDRACGTFCREDDLGARKRALVLRDDRAGENAADRHPQRELCDPVAEIDGLARLREIGVAGRDGVGALGQPGQLECAVGIAARRRPAEWAEATPVLSRGGRRDGGVDDREAGVIDHRSQDHAAAAHANLDPACRPVLLDVDAADARLPVPLGPHDDRPATDRELVDRERAVFRRDTTLASTPRSTHDEASAAAVVVLGVEVEFVDGRAALVDHAPFDPADASDLDLDPLRRRYDSGDSGSLAYRAHHLDDVARAGLEVLQVEEAVVERL